MSAPRRAALDCVMAVVLDDAYANLALPSILRKHRLDGRDAALATELTYGTLRQQGLYDAIIARASSRRVETLDTMVRAILWLGVHQALSMRIPTHAAVDQTVTLAKDAGAGRASGLVNAVMRRVTEASLEQWLARVAPGRTRSDIATRHSHPEWIVGELERSLAADNRVGETESLLAAHNASARVTLVARPGLADRDQLARATDSIPTELSPYGVVLGPGDPGDIEEVRDGTAAVQDEGSQLAALALVEAPLDGPDALWLDMCSGPGGKAALLGAVAAQRGAHVDALELHPHRVKLVEQAVRALPEGTVTVTAGDATEYQGGPYDRILLDAPCTGLGALRRRPESRWRRTPQDLGELASLQRKLLKNAVKLLRPGGVLAYVTCSPVLAETRDVVATAGVELIDAREVLHQVTGTANPWGYRPDVQLWTHIHGTDSMYIALLKAPKDR